MGKVFFLQAKWWINKRLNNKEDDAGPFVWVQNSVHLSNDFKCQKHRDDVTRKVRS